MFVFIKLQHMNKSQCSLNDSVRLNDTYESDNLH